MAKLVTVIPAKKESIDPYSGEIPKKKKVAAYARVSTVYEEQRTSFEAQRDYYEKYIKSNSEWEFVNIYADEGISATSTKHRVGFNKMVKDALNGKIDLIITKSVSRFARNTVDTLTNVRKLKDKNVEVYFEKENIFSFDSKGELMLTLLSSLAQEESRNLSTNITWGQRKRFADGKVSLPYGQFLGYEKGEDDLPKIVEKEAKIVRKIYRLFLEGKTPSGIARQLTEEKITTPGGKKKWHSTTVKSILQNEKYKGEAKLQKTYTVNFLTKKTKINEGEVPQYYVENSHPAIIDPEIYELVQEEFKRRKAAGKYTSAINCFASCITCGDCGGFYGRKVWHSNSKYARTVWQCNNKFQKRVHCSTPHLKEEVIKDAFVGVFNSLIENKEEILGNYEVIIDEITDMSGEEDKKQAILDESDTLRAGIEKLIAENSRKVIDQNEYKRRYDPMVSRYNGLQIDLQELEKQITMKKARYTQMKAFIKKLKERDELLTEFDEGLWSAVINTVIVKSDTKLVFYFKDKTEIPWFIGGDKDE